MPGAPGSVFYLGLGVLFSSNSALSASSVVNTLRSLPRHLRSLCGPSVTSAVSFSLSSWLFSFFLASLFLLGFSLSSWLFSFFLASLFLLGFSLCPLRSYPSVPTFLRHR